MPSGRPPRRGWPAVLALHGYGRDEASFTVLLRRRFGKVPWVWILPRGPWKVHPGPGRSGYAWLVSGPEGPDREGLEGTERLLEASWMAASKTLRLDPERRALAGFSQGGFAAGVCALRNPRAWKAAAVLSSYLNLDLTPKTARAHIAFFHGRQDRDVLPARAKASAEALGAPVFSFPGGHALTGPMANAARGWLAEVLAR